MPPLNRRTLMGASLLSLAPAVAAAQSNLDWLGIKRLMQGPVLGWARGAEAVIWTRASGPWPICIEYDLDPLFPNPQRSGVLAAEAAEDFIQVHRLAGAGARSHLCLPCPR